MLGRVRDGFVSANRVAAHAVDIDRTSVFPGDGNAEPDVSTADVRDQSEHRRTVEMLFALRIPRQSAP